MVVACTYHAEAREEDQGNAEDVDGDVDLVVVVRAILWIIVSMLVCSTARHMK